jgi:hypothetical protein
MPETPSFGSKIETSVDDSDRSVGVDRGHSSVGGGGHGSDEGGHGHCDSKKGVDETHVGLLRLLVGVGKRVWDVCGERRGEASAR